MQSVTVMAMSHKALKTSKCIQETPKIKVLSYDVILSLYITLTIILKSEVNEIRIKKKKKN